VLVAKLFVCIKIWENKFTLPVFRVCVDTDGSEDEASFVDSTGRVYKDWNDYLQTNTLPKCKYCYPTNGFYCNKDYGDEDEFGKVDVSYGTSPACDILNRVKPVSVTGGMVRITLSAGVLVALFITVWRNLAVVSTAVVIGSVIYFLCCSRKVRAGHRKNGRSTSVLDLIARAALIRRIASVLGTTARVETDGMVLSARSGHVFNRARDIAITNVAFGSLTINEILIANIVADLIDKNNHNEVKMSDFYQFTLEVLFFTHDVVDMQTASTVILEAQNKVIADYKARLNTEDQKAAFDKLASNTRGSCQMHGNGRVIKNLRQIENFEEFIGSLVRASDGQEHSVEFINNGIVHINGQLKIHADAFQEMDAENQAKAMDATRKLAAGEYTSDQFLNEIHSVCKKERIKFESQRKDIMRRAAESFQVENLDQVKVNGKAIFENLLPPEKDRLGDVMLNAGSYDQNLAQIALNLAEAQKCTTPTEYFSMLEFATTYVGRTTKSATLKPNQSRNNYRNDLQKDLKNSCSEQFKEMNAEFNDLLAKIARINETSLFQYKCNKAATYHFYKHDGFGEGLVSGEEYFDILAKLFMNDVNRKCTRLSQEGDKARIIYTDPAKGVFGVLIQQRPLQGNARLYVATMYYDRQLVTEPRLA
jgi:hypothetical protein